MRTVITFENVRSVSVNRTCFQVILYGDNSVRERITIYVETAVGHKNPHIMMRSTSKKRNSKKLIKKHISVISRD